MWPMEYNRKRKQEHFWIILWRALELLKVNKSQKTIPVQLFRLSINSLKYQFKIDNFISHK